MKKVAKSEAVVPEHIAIIMDGNGRWATKRMLPRAAGHRAGGETVKKIVTHARKSGVKYLTLYAFSSENWGRPDEEVNALMSLFSKYLEKELDTLLENGVRFRVIGDRNRLSESLQRKMEEVEQLSSVQAEMELLCAISYGGRGEILDAVRSIASEVAAGKLAPDEIDEETFSANLYAPDVPDPDLLIRTSGENRISNFLLWQLAYSEMVVSDVLWPDFSESEFDKCVNEYRSRDRRYGLVQGK